MEYIELKKERKIIEWHDIIPIKTINYNSPKILMCPRIPKPLHGVAPRNILTQIDKDWWDRTRHKVYEANDLYCMCCGVHKTKQGGYKKWLDAHELYSIDYRTGKVKLEYIVALCRDCHSGIHFGRLTEEFKKGNIRESEFRRVISHANTVLDEAGLPPKNWDVTVNDNLSGNVPWKDWHLELEINGKIERFYSPWESEEEQNEYYANKQ